MFVRCKMYQCFQASAQYLGEEIAGWQDDDNQYVAKVHAMAKRCQQMADFARGGTSFTVSRITDIKVSDLN